MADRLYRGIATDACRTVSGATCRTKFRVRWILTIRDRLAVGELAARGIEAFGGVQTVDRDRHLPRPMVSEPERLAEILIEPLSLRRS